MNQLAKSTGLDPYGGQAAADYDTYHRTRLRTRLTTRRELGALEKALARAGSDLTVLDLPCGAGRFWPAFQRAAVKRLIAADVSEGMLNIAARNRIDAHIPEQLIHTSAFDIELPDDAVDFVACMRFLHHLAVPEERMHVLKELRRVSRRFVAVSLWVDGNLSARRRMQRQNVQPVPGFGRRICRNQADAEAEFSAAGFTVIDHFDVWPGLSMWRVYLMAPT